MKKLGIPIFLTRYSWDDGSWNLEVRLDDFLIARKKYKTEKEASAGEEEVKAKLAAAPEGDVTRVLVGWADWVHPDFVPGGRIRRERRKP